MAFSLIPRARCESVFALDLNKLHARGIRLLLLDLDNTLIPYGTTLPDPHLLAWVAAVRAAGMEPFILSNSRKPTRVQTFAAALDVPHVRHAGKPKRKGFYEALSRMGCTALETVMLGDQIFTDILGANRTEIVSVLVHPIRMDTIFRRIRFGLETPFRRAAKEQW